MDENKIDHAVVLNLSQLYGNGLRLEEMKKALRFQNDYNAKIQKDNASKFTCGFVVHPGFIQGALWEIERCVEELDLRVLCLPTHFMDSIGQWRSVFDKENDPIFELANKYNLAIEVHPYDGEKMIKLDVSTMRRCLSLLYFKWDARPLPKHPNVFCTRRTNGTDEPWQTDSRIRWSS